MLEPGPSTPLAAPVAPSAPTSARTDAEPPAPPALPSPTELAAMTPAERIAAQVTYREAAFARSRWELDRAAREKAAAASTLPPGVVRWEPGQVTLDQLKAGPLSAFEQFVRDHRPVFDQMLKDAYLSRRFHR